jgi:hypothetical protein
LELKTHGGNLGLPLPARWPSEHSVTFIYFTLGLFFYKMKLKQHLLKGVSVQINEIVYSAVMGHGKTLGCQVIVYI